MSIVAITRSVNVKEGVWEALGLLDGLEELFQDKYVAIKPNDTWASAEDTTACTQADTVAALTVPLYSHS